MFWCDCLRILSCGLFGTPEEDDLELAPVHSGIHTEVLYTFAIEDSIISDDASSPPLSDHSGFVSPSSEGSCGSPWEVLEDLIDRI